MCIKINKICWHFRLNDRKIHITLHRQKKNVLSFSIIFCFVRLGTKSLLKWKGIMLSSDEEIDTPDGESSCTTTTGSTNPTPGTVKDLDFNGHTINDEGQKVNKCIMYIFVYILFYLFLFFCYIICICIMYKSFLYRSVFIYLSICFSFFVGVCIQLHIIGNSKYRKSVVRIMV